MLEIEGITLADHEKKAAFIKTRLCPRCGETNEADQTYCQKCSLILDETILDSKQQQENRADDRMDTLIKDPMVQKAIKEVVKRLGGHGAKYGNR